MRRMFTGLALVVAMATGAFAQMDANPDIQNTIRNQIDAFEANDFARAFTYAAPSIQMMFRTPENFGVMVQRGYPMVWRPDDVRFGDLREEGGLLRQKVIIRDKSGTVHVLDYSMSQDENGWKISGVVLLPSADVAA